MRLYLAVAVLMLAFVAYTEAQDSTVKQKLSQIGEHFTEMGKNLNDFLQRAHYTDYVSSFRNWAKDGYERIKATVGEFTN